MHKTFRSSQNFSRSALKLCRYIFEAPNIVHFHKCTKRKMGKKIFTMAMHLNKNFNIYIKHNLFLSLTNFHTNHTLYRKQTFSESHEAYHLDQRSPEQFSTMSHVQMQRVSPMKSWDWNRERSINQFRTYQRGVVRVPLHVFPYVVMNERLAGRDLSVRRGGKFFFPFSSSMILRCGWVDAHLVDRFKTFAPLSVIWPSLRAYRTICLTAVMITTSSSAAP